MPRDYRKPYKDVGEIERAFAPTGNTCDAHGFPEPCMFCINNRNRELFAQELLAQREYNGTED